MIGSEINVTKVSVIVPVYNAELYLKKCIDSILNQTYKDIEIIIVNDGSKDDSLLICRTLEKKDLRVVVIDKENEGVSKARNTGIKIAQGKYVMFVDADDYIESNMIENMLIKMEKDDSDLVMCNYINLKDGKTELVQANFSDILDHKKDIVNKLMMPLIERDDGENTHKIAGFRSPWGKIFKKQIIDEFDIKFNEKMAIGEDFLFNLEFISHSQKISFDSGCYYYYVNNENSALMRYKKNCWNNYYRPIIINLNKFLIKNNIYDQAKFRVYKLTIKYLFICLDNERKSNVNQFNYKYKRLKDMGTDEIIRQAVKNTNLSNYSKRETLVLLFVKYRIFMGASIIFYI